MVLYDPDTKLNERESKKFNERLSNPVASQKHVDILARARKNVKRL